MLFCIVLQENGINAELGLAASEDAILETLSERAEKEIVSGGSAQKNLIGHSALFLSKLCRNFTLMQKVSLRFTFLSGVFLLLTTHITNCNKIIIICIYIYIL